MIVLLCSLLGLFLNVIITYGLVFGKGPFPEIGFDIIVIFCLFMKFND